MGEIIAVGSQALASCRAGHYAGVVERDFELLGEIKDIETIAVNLSVRERQNLRARFGGSRWRKLKGVALICFPNGEVRHAELHWYEAHGVGRRKIKVKRVLD